LGCKNPKEKKKSSGAGVARKINHNVLVIDDDFDLSLPILKDRMIAAYRLICDKSTQSALMPTASYEEFKNAAIQDLKKPSDVPCRLEEGINNPIEQAQFDKIAPHKDQWNGGISNKNKEAFVSLPQEEILSTLGTYGAFHGTMVSSLIAYQNPDVRFVFLQVVLSTHEEVDNVKFTTCPKQELELLVKLYQDAEVRAAYAEAPLGPEDSKVEELIEKYDISVINKSLGTLPVAMFEEKYREAGCDISLSQYFELEGKLKLANHERGKHAGRAIDNVAIVQAAGNDGYTVNGPQDYSVCTGESNKIIIGAVNAQGQMADFSNRGSCVHSYAPGDGVLTKTHDDWFFPANGTSFSSPLFARYIVQHYQGKSVDETMKTLKAAGNLGIDSFPSELFLQSGDTIKAFALRNATWNKRATRFQPRLNRSILFP
jgi:hypothetical protein